MQYWTECQRFYRQFRQQYYTTGQILPSSRELARALTRPMRQMKTPQRIAEIWPGSGAVAAEIVRKLRPAGQFDIVEINGDFVAFLQERFSQEPDFRRRQAQSRIMHMPLQELAGEHLYDFMISG